MTISEAVRRLSVLLVAVAAAAVLLTEGMMMYRYFDGRPLLSEFGFDVHYLVMNSVLIASTGLLGVAAYQSRNPLLFIGSCGIGSWTLAHIYWTLYVYLAGQPISYPSVAELGFQGFYLVMIPAVVYLQQRASVDRPAWLSGTVVLLVGGVIGTNLMYGTSDLLFAYSIVSAILIGTALLFGLSLVLDSSYRLFGGGVCLFGAADGLYILLAISNPVLSVPYIDPVWYLSATLLAAGLIRYQQEGMLE